MANPTIKDLQESPEYELIAQLSHNEIKDFVIDQLTQKGKIVRFYMFYQVAMILIGIFFLIRAIVLAFKDYFLPFWISLAALIFSISLLIIIHELLHGIALKFTGAKKVNFGGYLKRFIFYAEADRHVLNRKQFAFIALAPLVTVQIVTLLGIGLSFHQPWVYFWITLMSAHSLFCAGDIALLSLLYRERDSEVFTFDVKTEKTSYYFRRIFEEKNELKTYL